MPDPGRAPRLIGVGDNIVDTYVDQGLQFPGGNAVNVAVLVGRLGIPTAYLGCLGTDEAGDLLASALTAEGVETTRVRRVAGANARVLIRHEDGERHFLSGRVGVRNRYRLGPADHAYIGGFDAAHTSVFSELDGELARLRAAAGLLSYDFSDFWNADAFARVLPHVDIAFISAPGRDDAAVEALLSACAEAGAGLAVATRGALGSMALDRGRLLRQGSAPATVVDTLGAGDGFIAGFLASVLQGATTATAMDVGARIAAEVCAWQGAFGHGAPWAGDPPPPETGA